MTDDHPVKVSGAKEELFSQFNQAIITARSYTNHFESEVAQPVAQVFVKLFEERPVLATFLGFLSAFSFVPILTFVTASGVTFLSFVTFALVISVSAAFAVIIGFLFLLISTLIATVFIAAITTNICFSVYLTFRLIVLVQHKGISEGFSCWIGEIWSSFLGISSGSIPFPNHSSHKDHSEVVESSDQ